MYGGGGNDTLNDAMGDDRLCCGDGAGWLDGGDGTDTLDGGPNNDECTRDEIYESCEAILWSWHSLTRQQSPDNSSCQPVAESGCALRPGHLRWPW